MTGGISYDHSMHGSLREEVLLLRKKVVSLETAEADNEKLRSEIARLQRKMTESKSQLELDFMNQLTGVARENALKLEELEGRLTASSKVNRALSEQLQHPGGPHEPDGQIQALETNHRREIVAIVDKNKEDTEKLHRQLSIVQSSRDRVTEKLNNAKVNLELKQKEADSLQLKVKALSSNKSSAEKTSTANGSLQKLLRDAHEESAKHRITVSKLQTELTKKSGMYENENKILQERLASRDAELNVKAAEIRRMSTEPKKWNRSEDKVDAVKSFEKENMNLKISLRKSETERRQQEATVQQLKRGIHELKMECQRLERESKVFLSEPVENEASSRGIADSPLLNAHEKRTTQIIRRLENNLKREGQVKQCMTSSLKFKKSLSEADPHAPSAPVQNESGQASSDALRSEVVEVKQKLDKERGLTCNLRREISELKASQSRSPASKLSAYEAVSSQQVERENGPQATRRSTLSVVPPTKSKQQPIINQTKKSPRTPVRGLVQSFERRISQAHQLEPPTIQRETDIFESENIEELKEAFHFERNQVFDLEDELTRQCEINCSLLKEIGSLTSETEASRTRNTQDFETSRIADQKEIEQLSSDISKLKSQLSQAEESKVGLSKQFADLSLSDKREIDRLTSELVQLKSNISMVEESKTALSKEFELVSTADRREIDRLKLSVHQLQTQLNKAEETTKKLQDEDASSKKKLEREKRKISEQEQCHLEDKCEIGTLMSRIYGLETEVADANDIKSAYASRDAEIAGLNSLVEALQSNLGDSDETKVALEREKEAGGRLDELVKDLKNQLSEAERNCETLSKDYSKSSLTDREEITGLRSQVESLATELATAIESRDESEENDRIHHEKFEILQSQVDTKVDEFESTHSADKEEIGRLQDQVKSLEQELQDTLSSVEEFKKQLQEKEQVEDTVEELARKNQYSLDSQINKLQTELTKTQVAKSGAEVDYRKQMQGLEDMIDSMQVEIDETLEEKQVELEDLKRSMDDKESMINRLTNEKEQLVLSMNDMTSSRRSEIDELQTELMEMSTRAANQAREVQTLKLQLEDSSYRKEEVERLRARVRELSDQLTSKNGSRSHDRTDLEIENSDLRQKLRHVSVERQNAEDKLREQITDKGGSSKSVQVLRERNAALKFEVEKLTKKLKKLAERKLQATSSNPVERFMI